MAPGAAAELPLATRKGVLQRDVLLSVKDVK
jgi:hypothetical protein